MNSMLRYLIRRMAFMGVTVLAVCALTFFLMNIIPGGTAELILKHTVLELEDIPTDEQIAEISSKYNLHDPLYVQFGHWLASALKGDLGSSYIQKKPVSYLLLLRLPATILLAFSAMSIAIVFGVPLGIFCAVKENKLTDYILRIVTLIGVSMPGFWLALLLILLFSVNLKLFPVAGYGELKYLVLPAVALSAHSLALTLRMVRTGMLEVMSQPYIAYAVSKGLPPGYVILRHALKNALLPAITVLGMSLGHMLGGAVVIESIFTWPGVGSLLVDAISGRDIPLVLGCVLTIVGVFVTINLLVDLAYTYLDPRIRYG
ncbi:MAG TPA: ABC transporter permease [Methanothrix sp.]|nr:ABC transporter permease [Methanothrix sp.]